jgi:hypothetical protein
MEQNNILPKKLKYHWIRKRWANSKIIIMIIVIVIIITTIKESERTRHWESFECLLHSHPTLIGKQGAECMVQVRSTQERWQGPGIHAQRIGQTRRSANTSIFIYSKFIKLFRHRTVKTNCCHFPTMSESSARWPEASAGLGVLHRQCRPRSDHYRKQIWDILHRLGLEKSVTRKKALCDAS